jgi:hypothetical protein
MVTISEQNFILQAQLTKIAPQKNGVPIPKGTSVDQQNPNAVAINAYFGEQKNADKLKEFSAAYANPQQRMTFDYSYHSFGHGFDPATDIAQLDIQKILVDTKEPSLELNKPDSAAHAGNADGHN